GRAGVHAHARADAPHRPSPGRRAGHRPEDGRAGGGDRHPCPAAEDRPALAAAVAPAARPILTLRSFRPNVERAGWARPSCCEPRARERPMTDADKIKYLWTHKTQDHTFLSDEELVIERGEGVWVWTERGHKLMDAFAGLAVVNVGHGRREIAEAIAEQTVRLAYYPTTRQFSNRPAAELAAKLATLTPGDLDYSFFAVSGAEANERAMQMARHYWLASGKPDKH